MLTDEQIRKVVTEYFQDKPVRKVYLFGSYARREATEASDVDLSFVLDDDAHLSYFTLAGYLLELERKLNRKVDLVEEKQIYESIRPAIDRSKILILEK